MASNTITAETRTENDPGANRLVNLNIQSLEASEILSECQIALSNIRTLQRAAHDSLTDLRRTLDRTDGWQWVKDYWDHLTDLLAMQNDQLERATAGLDRIDSAQGAAREASSAPTDQ